MVQQSLQPGSVTGVCVCGRGGSLPATKLLREIGQAVQMSWIAIGGVLGCWQRGAGCSWLGGGGGGRGREGGGTARVLAANLLCQVDHAVHVSCSTGARGG
jgi:hypothetical protein